MKSRTALVAAVTASVLIGASAPAFAEDCFNASRSATGNVSAGTHSQNWWTVPELLSVLGGLTPDQVAQVMPVIESDPRIPADFTVFYNPVHPGELAHSISEAIATDGKGIDHSDDYSSPVFGAIFQDVAIALG